MPSCKSPQKPFFKAPSLPSNNPTPKKVNYRISTSSSDSSLPSTLKHLNGIKVLKNNDTQTPSKGKENTNVRPNSSKKSRKKIMDASDMLVGNLTPRKPSTPKLVKSNSEMSLKVSNASSKMTTSCTDLRTPTKAKYDAKNMTKKLGANMTPDIKLSKHSITSLNSRISQLEEIEHSTKEELQATLQELTDLQGQLISKQKENDELQKQLESRNIVSTENCSVQCAWQPSDNTHYNSFASLIDKMSNQCKEHENILLTRKEADILLLFFEMFTNHVSSCNVNKKSDLNSDSNSNDSTRLAADQLLTGGEADEELENLKTELKSANEHIQELELKHQIEVMEWDKFKDDLLTAVKVANNIKIESENKVISLSNELKQVQDQVSLLKSQLNCSKVDGVKGVRNGAPLERKRSVKDLVQQVEKSFNNNGGVPVNHHKVKVLNCEPKVTFLNSGEKKDPLAKLLYQGGSRRNALLNWVQNRLEKYSNVDITNFSSSWNDGMALCALLHSYVPDKIDFHKLDPKNTEFNLQTAFSAAESINIPTTLKITDLTTTDRPDWKKVMEYVTSIYSHFEI